MQTGLAVWHSQVQDQAGSGIAGVGYGGAVEVDGLFWVQRSFLVTLCPAYVVRKM